MYKAISLIAEEGVGFIEGYISDQIQEQLINRCGKWKINVDLATKKVRKRFAILESLYVDEEMRGLGIGANVIQQFIDKCQEYEVDVIFLEADMYENNSFNLIDWYKQYGFKDLVRQKHIMYM